MKSPVIARSAVSLTELGVQNSPAKLVPAGSVLLVVRSGILKHTLPVALTSAVVTMNQDMKALVPKATVHAPYLARLVKSLQPTVLGWVRATTADNFPIDKLLDYEIDVPPIEEQRRIAAILDQADDLRVKQSSAISCYEDLTQSIFLDMFGSPATWSSRWEMGTIGDMAEDVQYGTAAKAGATGEWPIIRMGNITDDGRLDLADLKWIDLANRDLPKFTVKRGDLLFNRTNSREKVGKTCVVAADQPLAFAGYLIRVRFKPEHCPEFVNAYLTSDFGRALRLSMAKPAVNQANISASEMRRMPIACPPSTLQRRFADALSLVDVERERQLTALSETQELFAALQSRAFSGQL